MMSFSSISAVIMRHLYLLRRDTNFLLGVFYWPTLDILIWGFLGSWIAKSQMIGFTNYEIVALLGILLWQIVGRGLNIMLIAFAEELWANNIINLFSLPLRISEWIIGVIIFNSMVMGLTATLSMLIIYFLYAVSFWQLLTTFFIFMPPLFIASIAIAFTCLQIVVNMGKRGVELAFIGGWFLAPFSGAYYPIEVLPLWAQKVSMFLPMSYTFQGMRAYVMHQQDPTIYLIKGYALSILYAIGAVLLFVYFFNRCKQKGLARLVD